MKKENLMKTLNIGMPIFYIALGLFMIIFNKTILDVICPSLVIPLSLVAIAKILSYLMKKEKTLEDDMSLGSAVLYIVLSIVLLTYRNVIIGLIPLVIGLLISVIGTKELQNNINITRTNKKGWIQVGISIVNIVYGIIIIINKISFLSGTIALGIALLISGLSSVIISVISYFMNKKSTKLVKTEDNNKTQE